MGINNDVRSSGAIVLAKRSSLATIASNDTSQELVWESFSGRSKFNGTRLLDASGNFLLVCTIRMTFNPTLTSFISRLHWSLNGVSQEEIGLVATPAGGWGFYTFVGATWAEASNQGLGINFRINTSPTTVCRWSGRLAIYEA